MLNKKGSWRGDFSDYITRAGISCRLSYPKLKLSVGYPQAFNTFSRLSASFHTTTTSIQHHIVARTTAIQRPSPLQRDVGPKIMFSDGQMSDGMRGGLGQKLHQGGRGGLNGRLTRCVHIFPLPLPLMRERPASTNRDVSIPVSTS